MPRTCSLAAAQTIPVPGDVGANRDQHLQLARLAAGEGAGLVVFPELSLTGYELERAAALAFTEGDPRLDPLRGLAAALGITLVVGAPVQLGLTSTSDAYHSLRLDDPAERRGRRRLGRPSEGSDALPALHIGAFILSASGGIDLYTKQRLGAFPGSVSPDGIVPPPEATFFSPGDRNPLVPLGDRDAAIAVCADIGRPAHAEEAAERGARVYLASMFVIPADFPQDVARLASYAARHQMTVVLANYGAPSGGLPSAGRSAVWSPGGELLASLPEAGSGIVVAAENDGDAWSARAISG